MTVTDLLKRAHAKGLRIATAESCTGGMVSAKLTEITGSSDVFECGFITYSNAAKRDMLGVVQTTIAAHGAVSEPVATEMAEGALTRSQADLTVSITGIAGPGRSENKPEGRVCFALARKDTNTIAHTIEFGAVGRENVRRASTTHALKLLAEAVDLIST